MTTEAALHSIPGFRHARIRRLLADGPTNKATLIDNFDSKYVLREDKPSVVELGLDRIAEEEICRMVASAGLAPEPVYYNHSTGVSLRRFVAGTNWLESDLHNASWLKRLAAMLRKLHKLPEAGAKFDPGAAAQRYAQQLGTDEAAQLQEKASRLLTSCREMQDKTCLCHNDLLNHNILESDRIVLIDWEFAGMGDPYFDLAVVLQHHGLGEKLGKQFLKAYLQRKPNDTDLERLRLSCEFYAALLALWDLRLQQL